MNFINPYYKILLYYKKTILINCFPIQNVSPEISINDQYRMSMMRENDIENLLKLHDNYDKWYYMFSASDVENRLKKGHKCFICYKNNELVGFTWIGINSVYSPDLLCKFDLGKNCIVGYNSYVRPDCRGNKICSALRQFGFEKFRGKGFIKGYNYNLSTNKSIIKTYKKFGTVQIGKIYCGYFLGYYYFFQKINRNEQIKVNLQVDPWYRWKEFMRNRFIKIKSN